MGFVAYYVRNSIVIEMFGDHVMSRLTTDYGEFISQYEGVGQLNDINCSFEVGQKPDSTIIVYCSSKEVFDPDTRLMKLYGSIADGSTIRADGKVSPLCSLVTGGDPSKSYCFFRSFAGFRMFVGSLEWSLVTEVRFSIANFRFSGNDERNSSNWTSQDSLAVSVGGFDLCFHKKSNYAEVVRDMRVKDAIGITSELIVKVDGQSMQQVVEFANNICILLSIAAGRSIDWVNMSAFDSNSSLLLRYLQNKRISAVSGLDMIDLENSKDLADFLTQSYPEFKRINPEYEIDRVAFVLGDLRPHPFLETRALLMYSIVDSFTQKVSNNESLEARLKHLLNTFRVSYKNKEANHFATSRNSIAHKFDFGTSKARDEYFRNLDLYHRLLLRMLGYDSYYHAFSKSANITEPLRQKLKIAKKPVGN